MFYEILAVPRGFTRCSAPGHSIMYGLSNRKRIFQLEPVVPEILHSSKQIVQFYITGIDITREQTKGKEYIRIICSKWYSVVSAYFHGKKSLCHECMSNIYESKESNKPLPQI